MRRPFKRLGGILFLALLQTGLFNAAILLAETEAPDAVALDQERRMKEDTERQAQAICDSILGKGRSSVLASIEVGLETTRKGGSAVNRKLDNKSGGTLTEENYLLPWVPAPKSVTKEEVPKDANVETQAAQQEARDVKTVIKRFDITVVHDNKIPEDRVILAKETLGAAFDRYKDILKILFKATSFVQDVYDPKDVVKKNFTDSINLRNLILLLLLMLAMMLLRFFFGPLADFMRSYIEGMREQSKSKVEMDNKSETESETEAETEEEGNLDGEGGGGGGYGELSAEEQDRLAMEDELMRKFQPFRYVTDENIKQLAYLLVHEEPWIVAMVLSYLSAEHAFKVMEVLPADLQAKVALETAMYRQTSLEQVQAIDEDIKQKIDFVVGGIEKLTMILENSDKFARDNILEYLKNEKPAIYERVREKILMFDDIVNFPRPAMQLIVRELKTEQLARALRGVSPELQQKFTENMSQGAVTLLKEEMEYGRPVTDEQIEEDRRKIVELIKTLESEGKIQVRQKNKTTNDLELGMEMSGLKIGNMIGTTTPPSAEEASAAYAAGTAAAEQGNWEEAISQLEKSVQGNPSFAPAQQALASAYYSVGRYAETVHAYDAYLQLEPNPELQAWVDQLRASVTAQAA